MLSPFPAIDTLRDRDHCDDEDDDKRRRSQFPDAVQRVHSDSCTRARTRSASNAEPGSARRAAWREAKREAKPHSTTGIN